MSTATTTVLFTDLVGSTSLLSRVGPDRAEGIRREHLGLLQAAVARFGGTEVKNLGDGIMVVFPSLSDGLGCGVAMHQAVEARNRRATEPTGLRVALAHGEADIEGADYFGPCVVEAARLCSAAEGGELLTTALVALMMRGRGGFSFGPRMAVRAKGFPEPIEAHLVEWAPAPNVSAGAMPAGLLVRAEALPLVGRGDELTELLDCWKRAAAGERQMVFVSGEPGIGKTRLAAEVARLAFDDGAVVLFGRCDQDVGVGYQPFAEALGDYVAGCPQEDLEAHAAMFGGVALSVVPELGRRLPSIDPAERSDPDAERQLLFEALIALIATAAQRAPVLLVLDDLHWASKPTLLLLRHLLRAAQPTELMVVATYRDTDLDRTHPLAELLTDLRRAGGSVRIALAGLDEAGVRAFVEAAAGEQLDAAGVALAHAIHAETEGNPFFTGEVLAHLAESGAVYQRDGRWVSDVALADLGIPEGIREVVGRRMARLSVEANKALSIAAVCGAEFELRIVEEVGGFDADTVLDAIDEAITARLVVEVVGQAGRCRFAHALVRQTLYAECSSARRAQWHRRIAEAIEMVHGNDSPAQLGALAHHFAEGARAGDTTKAVDYALRAAEEASGRTAFEEAEAILGRALGVLELDPLPDPTAEFELVLESAVANQRSGFSSAWVDLGFRAASIARQIGDPIRLARAAQPMSFFSSVRTGRLDSRVDALCGEALDALGDRDDALRAKLLTGLAVTRAFGGVGWATRSLALEAVATSERTQDPEAKFWAMFALAAALDGTADLPAQYEAVEAAIALGASSNNPFTVARARALRVKDHAAAGRRSDLEADVDFVAEYANHARALFLQALVAEHRATLAILDGRFDIAETLAASVLGITAEEPTFLLAYFAQMALIRYEQGRLAEFMPGALDVLAQNHDLVALRALVAFGQAELGESGDALARLEPLVADDCAIVPRDWLFPGTLAHLAAACARLDHATAAVPLIGQLKPYSGQLLLLGSAVAIWGAADRHLAMLETLIGRFEHAEAHFRAAITLEEGAGGVALAARSRYWYARMLARRNHGDDKSDARRLLAECLTTSQAIGMQSLTDEVQALAHQLARERLSDLD